MVLGGKFAAKQLWQANLSWRLGFGNIQQDFAAWLGGILGTAKLQAGIAYGIGI